MPAKGENSKKAAGNARKAEAAAAKQAQASYKAEAAETAKWNEGAKSNAKSEAAAAKQAEAARKKAEKDALLKEEEASLPSKAGKGKTAVKKSRGLDLSGLDAPSSKSALGELSASGIDNALDALSLDAQGGGDKVDRHPERRFKAAYTAYEERRMEELKEEKGLRRQQKIDKIRKEFEKHPDNPFNQVAGQYNSTREELREIQAKEREKIEQRLGG